MALAGEVAVGELFSIQQVEHVEAEEKGSDVESAHSGLAGGSVQDADLAVEAFEGDTDGRRMLDEGCEVCGDELRDTWQRAAGATQMSINDLWTLPV